MRNPGFYAGTLRMEQPWYQRSARHGGFPEKGPGEYWYDYKGFYFVGEKSNRGLVIPAESVVEVKLAFWHAFFFSSKRILKIVWRSGGERLSSGFVIEHAGEVRQALTTRGWA